MKRLNQFQNLSHKVFAVVLAWFFWWIPLGLHRLWMRQPYWWLHTLLFLLVTIASNIFFRSPENIEIARHLYTTTHRSPHLFDYSHTWLFGFAAAWIVLIAYDAVKVFSWPVPSASKESELSDA